MKLNAVSLIVVLLVGAVLGVFGMRWLDSNQGSIAQTSTPAKAVVSAPASTATLVEVAPVVSAIMPRSVTAVGSLRSKDSVMLRPEVAGRISEINFEEGGSVKKGQVLVRLDDSVVRAQLGQAEANFKLAASQSRRAGELSKQGFISKQAVDDALNQLQVQRASVALAQAHLDKTAIVAPFDGMIGLRNVSVGDYVSPGIDLVTIESIDPLQVDFRIPEHHLGVVSEGLKLSVRFDALPGVVREGVVDAISPLVDVGGRSILLRANIPNDDATLRPGLFARVQLQLSDGRVLIIPESALEPSGETQYAYRLREGRVERVAVETGQRREGNVEITRGLNEGDEVVVAGLQKISDGAAVRVASPGATSGQSR